MYVAQKQINEINIDVCFDKKKYVMYMFIKVSRHQLCLFIISLTSLLNRVDRNKEPDLRIIKVNLAENIEKPMSKLIP